jgi:tetratricopeptide (TPR) repeat protein
LLLVQRYRRRPMLSGTISNNQSMLRTFARSALLGATLLAVALFSPAQQTLPSTSHGAKLSVRVVDSTGQPFAASAEVSLSHDRGQVPVRKSTADSHDAVFENLAPGVYFVLVSAPGYTPAQDQVFVDASGADRESLIQLEPTVAQNTRIAGLQASAVDHKAQKALSEGIREIQAGQWSRAQDRLNAAFKAAPNEPVVNYLKGFACLESGDLITAERFLLRAASLDPQNAAVFVAIGQLRLKQNDLQDAAVMFQQAVSLDSSNWNAHWLLADVDMTLERFDEAQAEAEAAVTSGKGVADGAWLIVGEASAALGDTPKAKASLTAFLSETSKGPQSAVAQSLLDTVASQDAAREIAARNAEGIRAAAVSALANPLSLPRPDSPGRPAIVANFALPPWAPAGVDDSKPSTQAEPQCWLPFVLDKTSSNVQRLVTDLSNIDAREKMDYEELDEVGKPAETHERKYEYMASFDEVSAGNLTMNELRDSKPGLTSFPLNITPTGLTSMALVFHPFLRDDFQMTCEGLGEWRGSPAWIVYFRQKDGVTGRLSGWSFNGRTHPLSLKGRAWITRDTYQVAHIETDLISPMPEIQLLLEHMSVDYEAVPFRNKQQWVWLPSSANMYFEYRRKRLHIRDSFTRYKLFSVGTSQTINNPRTAPPRSDESSPDR